MKSTSGIGSYDPGWIPTPLPGIFAAVQRFFHPLIFAGSPGLQAGRECDPRPRGAQRRSLLRLGVAVCVYPDDASQAIVEGKVDEQRLLDPVLALRCD
ncbi:hypothetical protein ACFVTC_42595 [Streptomyces sp. NPDC057950]|uniref:hypothetical protein n=1 Tax=Streptomyces sp. NPDC057950 TaxID=3346288 RepID=UPI0036EF430E